MINEPEKSLIGAGVGTKGWMLKCEQYTVHVLSSLLISAIEFDSQSFNEFFTVVWFFKPTYTKHN